MPEAQTGAVIRFSVFELEPHVGVLRKHGVRIRLQDQPFRVLLALLEKRGEIVTREELDARIWPGATVGDLDQRLNRAVNKIREALGDSAETPRFVETIPRRGYRFIAPVEGTPAPTAEPVIAPVRVSRTKRTWVAAATLSAIALTAGVTVLMFPPPTPRMEWRRLTNDSMPKFGGVLSDGARLYFRTVSQSGLAFAQVPISGGDPARLPIIQLPGVSYQAFELTPDRQEVLVASYERGSLSNEGPLWTVRLADGSYRRVGNLMVRVAQYSPDGRRLLFTQGGFQQPGSLWVASSDGSAARRLIEVKERRIGNPCWTLDGKRIVFSQLDRATEEQFVWEIKADGSGLRRLFPDWTEPHFAAGWSPDGDLILSSFSRLWLAQRPSWFNRRPARRIQLTPGEPIFAAGLHFQGGRTAYSVGTTPLGQLQRFDTRSRSWEPHLRGISAESVEFSKDGQRLVYSTYPGGELWVRDADGSHPAQLTKPPMQTMGGRWSPDGKTIAFAGRSPSNQSWTVYLVDAAGGNLRPACSKACRALDIAWMADGKKLVIGLPPPRWATGAYCLQTLDLTTGTLTKFPGTDQLFSPRISPDGSAVAALLVLAQHSKLMIHRFSEGVWRELSHPGPGVVDFPSWSRNGQSIWYYNAGRGAVMRCNLRDNRHEEILKLKAEELTGLIGFWFALTPDDEPLILRRRNVQQIYALELKPR